jgi:hypothetical protein
MYESAKISACGKTRCRDGSKREVNSTGLKQLSRIINNFYNFKPDVNPRSAGVMPALVR